MSKVKCEYCGKLFKQRVEWQKYCSTPCRIGAWAKRESEKK